MMAAPEGEENIIIPSAIKFTYQGLYRLCEILPLKELLKLRLVCKIWEVFITNHPRVKRSTTKFSENIFSINGASLDVALDREIFWRSVHLTFFPFSQKSILHDYWRIGGEYVTILYIQSLEVQCIDLVTFLNECPSVTNISFDDNGFRPKFPRKRYLPQSGPGRNRKQAIFCPHRKLHNKFFPPMDHTTFSSVTFSNQNVIPLCLLDYIIRRSGGKLKEFVFQHATCNSSIRERLHPSKEQVEDMLIELLRNNTSSLKKFSVINCRDIGHFLNRVSELDLNLQELTFDPMRLPSASREMDSSFGLNLLQSHEKKKVEILKIGFHDPDKGRLQDILTKYGATNFLKALKLTVAKGFNDIRPMLTQMTSLASLEIMELGHFRRHELRADGPVRGVNPNYLTKLPTSVHTLSISHISKGDEIMQLLSQSSNIIFIKQLKIDYTDIKDQMLQEIISQLRLLEILHIRNSKHITDAGIIGMTIEKCKSLKDYLHDPSSQLDFNVNEKSSVSNLKNLRELSFYGCRNISDVSIVFGIKLEKLRILDLSLCTNVTEDGFFHSLINNSKLERLILFDALISTNALLQMLSVRCSLMKIHLSEKTLQKQRKQYEMEELQTRNTFDSIFTDEPLPIF